MHIRADMRGNVANLLRIYAQTSQQEREQGNSWYTTANEQAAQLATRYNTDITVAAAVIAALSPSLNWDLNLQAAAAVFAHVATATRLPSLPSYGQNVARAKHIASTNDITSLSGQKVTAFYHNIAYPQVAGPATIDRHMLRAWLDLPNKGPLDCKNTVYQAAVTDFTTAANLENLLPHNFQAIIWIAVRPTKE